MANTERYRDRTDAGRQLAALLGRYAHRPDVRVLALPRGGVPVAFVVAEALRAPLDVFLIRKLGVPGQEELAMGAIASGDVLVLNEDVIRSLSIPHAVIERVAAEEGRELQRRERAYRDDRPPADVRGRTVIVVDDGLATGSSMRAAARALRRQQPARLVLAVPVGAPDTCVELRAEVDEVVCGRIPASFIAIGFWYDDFSQTTDEEVRELLRRARRPPPIAAGTR
ncbi:MAG: phosphoribosyltransferase [Chloroflexota bacterium]